MQGSSSRLFLHRRSLALSAAAPDLGHGVAPLGHARLLRRLQPPVLSVPEGHLLSEQGLYLDPDGLHGVLSFPYPN